MELQRLFCDPEIDRIVADLNQGGWRVRLDQMDDGWVAEFRRVRDTVEEISQSGEPKEALEAIREAAAGTQAISA
jgi:hypothetical protein